jgi:hypothetical protein
MDRAVAELAAATNRERNLTKMVADLAEAHGKLGAEAKVALDKLQKAYDDLHNENRDILPALEVANAELATQKEYGLHQWRQKDLAMLARQRAAAAAILELINEAREKKCSTGVLIDWHVKLARVAAGYALLDRDEPHDLLQIRADLDRLTPEQLLALKTIALIAAGGSTGGEVPGGTAAAVRRTIQGKAGREREGKDPPKR